MKYIFLFLLFPILISAQETITSSIVPSKPNPIIFGELYGGFGAGNSFGALWGTNINFQHKKSLFTIRHLGYSGIENNKVRTGEVTHIMIFPSYENVQKVSEFSLLYGNRYIKNKSSFSWSVGLGVISQDRRKYNSTTNKYENWYNSTHLGTPLELNVKWFSSKKRKFRAPFGTIPLTEEKVGFGRSYGIKFIGNISKTSYFGFAATYGFGTHKNYSEIYREL